MTDNILSWIAIIAIALIFAVELIKRIPTNKEEIFSVVPVSTAGRIAQMQKNKYWRNKR